MRSTEAGHCGVVSFVHDHMAMATANDEGTYNRRQRPLREVPWSNSM